MRYYRAERPHFNDECGLYLYCGQCVGVLTKDMDRFLEPTRYKRQTIMPVMTLVKPHEFSPSQMAYREPEKELNVNLSPTGKEQ